jgi:hypothetical protein
LLHWDGTDGDAARDRSGRRRRAPAVAIAATAIVVAVVATLVAVRAGPEPAVPDRYALDQVALRYRALGAGLLDGALRCTPIATQPGRTETVDCTFGAWSVVLTGYDSRAALDAARSAALAPAPGSLRHAQAVQDDAAFAMDETEAGGASVHWDTTAPRPVSATITTSLLPLPDLLAFYDSRGAGLLTRPEQPGPAFRSATLWAFARSRVLADNPACAPVPDWRNSMQDAIEAVKCTYPDGTVLGFARLRDLAAAQRYREDNVSAEWSVPGTLRVGAWAATDDPTRAGTLVEYVYSEDGDSSLYFDDLDTFCFGLVIHPDLTQDQLKAFWAQRSFREVEPGTGSR